MISEHPAYQQTISDLRNGFDDADAIAANYPRAVYSTLSYDIIAIYKLLEQRQFDEQFYKTTS